LTADDRKSSAVFIWDFAALVIVPPTRFEACVFGRLDADPKAAHNVSAVPNLLEMTAAREVRERVVDLFRLGRDALARNCRANVLRLEFSLLAVQSLDCIDHGIQRLSTTRRRPGRDLLCEAPDEGVAVSFWEALKQRGDSAFYLLRWVGGLLVFRRCRRGNRMERWLSHPPSLHSSDFRVES
jgi:hypothetical protein